MTFEDFLDMMSTFSEAVSFGSNFVNTRAGSYFSRTIDDLYPVLDMRVLS